MTLTLLKLGGELLENEQKLAAMGRMVARLAGPLAIVHGGGREIDAALAELGIPRRQVDGLRVTDARTLDVVVSVLAGAVNTRFVAAINGAGGRAVGLTGADAGVAPVRKAPLHHATSGEVVDLGLVGEPTGAAAPALLTTLVARRFVPVIACIGAARNGQLFNVNADTLAGSLAARLGATRLIVAGGTPGVLDEDGQTIPALGPRDIRALVQSGTASAGMVAKLVACQAAARRGVKEVAIVDGRDTKTLGAFLERRVLDRTPFAGTRVTP
ncbi:MAG: acetylglutamate kinase [Acidobacteria bacterium]|nr:acetylglutamate kinase [Acidobacteriota bacterium]